MNKSDFLKKLDDDFIEMMCAQPETAKSYMTTDEYKDQANDAYTQYVNRKDIKTPAQAYIASAVYCLYLMAE